MQSATLTPSPSFVREMQSDTLDGREPNRKFVSAKPQIAMVSMLVLLGNTSANTEVFPVPLTVGPNSTAEQFKLSAALPHLSTKNQGVKHQLVQAIRELASLSAGWHGKDSVPASQQAIDDAERFVMNLNWESRAKPNVALTEDGEVNLVWTKDSHHLDIGFFGDGTYAFFAKNSNDQSYWADSEPVAKALPENVLTIIASG